MKKMTKKTKRNLTWKLDNLPTAGELADLVDSEVISKEEAREIMFGQTENLTDKIKAYEEQLDFLRDLVTELTKQRNNIQFVPYTREIRYYNQPYWQKTYDVLCKSGLDVSKSTLTTTGGAITGTAVGGTVNLSSAGTAGYISPNGAKTMMMTVSANNNSVS